MILKISKVSHCCRAGHGMVKRLFLAAAIMLLGAPMPASADGLFFETGRGFYFSAISELSLLRYQHETTPLFGLSSYYEGSYASWNGPDHAEAVGLARGVRWQDGVDANLSFTAGLSRISRTTSNLGQPFEFYSRWAYEKKLGKALVSIGWIHYSDGKFFFHWSGPNNSENFLTLSLGMIF